ncbi:threonine-phosphate decarboxylase [Paracoccus sp. S3-43]|uniref:threonine-phosphate decarboxylase n=1 Tax=Paracoccus sp. S3-43 TaxID=3030011 RepID=UPI0023B17891|nr:threonine-phosphate decarboxylase [Paracoccus sp. S3-43]WEF23580.1 threonine-phosphate decarboxylase [Paracoccus sp. S3-43]
MQDGPGGDIDKAAAQGWIDLSGAVNRRPWPGGANPAAGSQGRLARAAADWLGCDPAQVVAVADARAAILRLPPGRAAVLAGSDASDASDAVRLRAAGWQVAQVAEIRDMVGADLAVVRNPDDADGREWRPEALSRLARQVGHLVLDESLADPRPDLSLAPALPANALILRDLFPFWGLRGLGLVLAHPALLDRLSDRPPPDDTPPGGTAPDGTALALGAQALADRGWADQTILYLAEAALRLDRLAVAAGWRPAGGTHLFRLYDSGDAAAAQDQLARARIRLHRPAWPDCRLRLGIPADHAEWDRLSAALREF